MFDPAIFDRYSFDDGQTMASNVISAFSVCAGGGHIHFNSDMDGGAAQPCQMDEAETMSALTNEEKLLFTRLSLRAFAQGKTWAQVKTAVQTGMTVKV